MTEPVSAARTAVAPLSVEDPANLPTVDMTLAEAVQMAIRQSPVIRDIGGSVVTNPGFVPTVYDPSLAHANPLTGVDAALSAFDAQWVSSLAWNKVDQPNNINTGAGGGVINAFSPSVAQGTGATFNAEVNKRTAQGARFACATSRSTITTTVDSDCFHSDFSGYVEAEWRQPLMRGAGTEFNRIAGPNSLVGQYNGVLIARINEDVAFIGLRSGSHSTGQ